MSFLYLGYDGAVDPTPYLDAWSTSRICRSRSPPAGRRPSPAARAAPEPGAILLGMTRHLDRRRARPGSLERALAPLDALALMQTLVPTAVPRPTGDLGAAAEPERRR